MPKRMLRSLREAMAKNPLMPGQPTTQGGIRINAKRMQYWQDFIDNPNTTQKERAASHGIHGQTAGKYERALRQDMRSELRKVYFRGKKSTRVPRSGLLEELEGRIRKNPYGQLPSQSLARKYAVSRTVVIKLASQTRKRLGFAGKIPKGGARIRYPENVQGILQEFARQSKITGKPVELRKVIIQVAKQTRQVVSPYGVLNWLKRLGCKASRNGIIGSNSTLKEAVQTLKEAGLKPGVDFEIPKQRRD